MNHPWLLVLMFVLATAAFAVKMFIQPRYKFGEYPTGKVNMVTVLDFIAFLLGLLAVICYAIILTDSINQTSGT